MRPVGPHNDRSRQEEERRRRRRAGRQRLAVAGGLLVLLILAIALGVGLSRRGDGASLSTTTSTTSGSVTSTTTGFESTTSTSGVEPSGTQTFSAQLSGDSEVPPVTTQAAGTLSLTVAADGSSVDYVLEVSDITNLTVARLHQGAEGANGTTIVTLYSGPTKSGAFTGTVARGSFTANDLTGPLKGKTIADLVSLLTAGSVYLNVGTAAHRSGEIRGQLEAATSGNAGTG